jgi:hypothetical protein
MRKAIIAAAIVGATVSVARADEWVHGYVRPNGTEVQPYHRTAPDSTLLNNYSTRGNVNPYTGAPGTVDPYRTHDSFSTPVPSFGRPLGNEPSGATGLMR